MIHELSDIGQSLREKAILYGTDTNKDAKSLDAFAAQKHLTDENCTGVPWRDSVVTTVVLTLCLIIGCALRCEGLDSRSMWFDESYTWRMAFHPPAEILQRLRSDNSPPLYYLLVKYWMAVFGAEPSSARLLSVVCSLAAVVGMFLFTRELLTGALADSVSCREVFWGPLLTAVLIALSPLQVRYGWEARMYALGTALAAFSAWTLLRAIDPSRRRWGRWLGFAAVTILFAYSHNFALLTIVTEAAMVAWWLCERSGGSVRQTVRQKAFAPAVVAFVLVAIGFGLWLPSLRAQLAFPYTRQWIPPLTSYTQLYTLCYHLFVDPTFAPAVSFSPIRITAAALGLGLVTAWRGRWVDGVALLFGLGPLLLAIAICLTFEPVLITRYFVFAQPFLLIVPAIAVARIRNPALFAAVAVISVTVSGYWCHDFLARAALDRHPGFRGAAVYLDKHRQSGELVLCADGMCYLPILCHLQNKSRAYVVTHPAGWAVGDPALDAERELLHPREVPRVAHGVVWVVNRTDSVDTGKGTAVIPIPNSWRETQRVTFAESLDLGTVIVIRYVTPKDGPGRRTAENSK